MLEVKNISFSYHKKTVLDSIEFNVEKGVHLSVIGESGSGKSTLLKLIYGEFDLTKGSIFWNSQEILGPKYNLVIGYDFMKYVAQEFDLMPYITVEENIGKFLSNFFPEEKAERINELLKVVELENVAKTKVQFLSGGQKQRVALARAIAKQPEIILLDEPFSHIDNFKKQSLRRSLFNYLKQKNITCIVATHDKNDVLPFADKMIVLNNGKVIANNSPKALYNNPKTPLVASFFGEFNMIEPFGILYTHQIKIVEKSNYKATVKASYYNGQSYLIEVLHNNKSIFIEHSDKLEEQSSIYFKTL
jgi:ABC-type Fe3+/spermidine/putrescine transport system ATPase subunit